MRKLSDATGSNSGPDGGGPEPDGAGEDPEKIEAEMGDLLEGKSRSCWKRKAEKPDANPGPPWTKPSTT